MFLSTPALIKNTYTEIKEIPNLADKSMKQLQVKSE